MERSTNTSIILGLLLSISLLAGCTSNKPRPIEVKDDNAQFSGAKFVYKSQSHEKAKLVREFEISYLSASGNSTQQLDTGQYIEIEKQTVNGPETLHHAYKTSKLDLMMRFNHKVAERLWLALGFGLGLVDQEITLTTSSQTFNHSKASRGGNLQLAAAFEITDKLSLNYQLTELYLGDIRSSDQTTYFQLTATPNIAVDLGYKKWDTNHETFGSDIEYELKGPWLGLVIGF